MVGAGGHAADGRARRRAPSTTRSSHARSATASGSSDRASLRTRSSRRSACSRSAASSSVSIRSMSEAGSTLPSGMRDAGGRVAADDVADRVGLADRGQEAVAEPLALGRAANQAGDVVELDRLVEHLRGADGRRDPVEPVVGYGDDRDVGLDRRERVVAGFGAATGQRVEEGRLARVRHTDDADLHPPASIGASVPTATPSSGAGEDVARVMHAEVGAGQGDRGRQRQGRCGQSGFDPADRGGGGERRRRVSRGEGQLAGHLRERRQVRRCPAGAAGPRS